MKNMIAVDKFFKKNYHDFTGAEGLPPHGLFVRMEESDYAAVYGIDDGPMFMGHSGVYCDMKRNPESIVILYECPHTGDKHRHHPDYDKPFEVELLCKRCHNEITNSYNPFADFSRFFNRPHFPRTRPVAAMSRVIRRESSTRIDRTRGGSCGSHQKDTEDRLGAEPSTTLLLGGDKGN
jgi:hypothetical protein